MRREKIKTALWFHADQWKALKKLASTMGRSVAQLVREAVDDLLKKYSPMLWTPEEKA
jgi:predicted DNA-binding protein